jgi:hypothetical protein
LDTVDQKGIQKMNSDKNIDDKNLLVQLNEVFGSYKAEWLKGKIFDFFAEPTYFPTLKGNRPCVLQGGRGTGKTTVLRGLSYQGQFALHNNSIEQFDNNEFIGIYFKVNTNHVQAFIGGGINVEEWQKVFSHYFNLIICREMLLFVKWHKSLSDNDETFSSRHCKKIANSLHISNSCDSFEMLLEEVDTAMYEFQAEINNISGEKKPFLSMAGDVIKLTTECAVSLQQFQNKIFYILIDEYESFTEYQQKCINTLIKHSTDLFTFKVGVKELGWKTRATLNEQETLNDPADFVIIDIMKIFNEGDYFKNFARDVCQQRIKELIPCEDFSDFSIEKALPSMSIEEEAIRLGLKNSTMIDKIKNLSIEDRQGIEKLSLLYQYFLVYWSDNYNTSLTDTISDYNKNKLKWNSRYDNYKYSMLFKIRKGRVGIKKYYSGWNVFLKLANGNIRYLMELVYRAYEKHLMDDMGVLYSISPENQTFAAQAAGEKNLSELEKSCKNGATLTKLLFGFGRIFSVLICENAKSAPEIDQIYVKGNISKECEEILRDSVMHLALIRIPGNKLSNENATKDFMYAIHPIYAPFFSFSHRKKRKMEVTEEELLGVINNPNYYINAILRKRDLYAENINESNDQLLLIEEINNND